MDMCGRGAHREARERLLIRCNLLYQLTHYPLQRCPRVESAVPRESDGQE